MTDAAGTGAHAGGPAGEDTAGQGPAAAESAGAGAHAGDPAGADDVGKEDALTDDAGAKPAARRSAKKGGPAGEKFVIELLDLSLIHI